MPHVQRQETKDSVVGRWTAMDVHVESGPWTDDVVEWCEGNLQELSHSARD